MVNDWLINVSNPHMPWTGQYRTWPQWCELLPEFGFKLKREVNLALRRVNGKIKQGVHMMGEFVLQM